MNVRGSLFVKHVVGLGMLNKKNSAIVCALMFCVHDFVVFLTSCRIKYLISIIVNLSF